MLKEIESIGYQKDSDIIVQPKEEYILNLDEFYFPAYDLVDLKDYYHSTSHWHNVKILISISLVKGRLGR